MHARIIFHGTVSALVFAAWLLPTAVSAQSTGSVAPTEETTGSNGEAVDAEFTPEELQQLAAPVALYPDTLLIQILVAATYPLEVSKADQFVEDNADQEPETLKSLIEEQGWDDSVTVLATAFPDTLAKMAEHISWTETIGAAMLVQSEDLLDAIQVKRAEANAVGNLQSGEEQTIEVTQEDNGDQTIIIEPTDPQVVYVPQYNTETVYVSEDSTQAASNSSGTNDAVATALMFFGTAILIDAIFNDDDHWYGYWGCRNCCGWNGRPIHHDPRRVAIGNDRNVIVNTGDVNVGWQPDAGREASARRTIQDRRAPGGATTLPARSPNRGDQLRRDLSNRTGTTDISRPQNQDALNRTRQQQRNGVSPGAANTLDRTKRPQQSPANGNARTGGNVQRQSAPAARTHGGALQQRAPAARTEAGRSRGKASRDGAGNRLQRR